MQTNIESKFKGYINTIEFDKQKVFEILTYILIKIENKFGEIYNDKFIEDLRNEFNILEEIMSYEDIYNINIILNEISLNINNATKFEELKLTKSPFFKYIEDDLSEGYYTKK